MQDGERGYLEGLASRYADLFSTHYGDVLSHLEDLRRAEWTTETERKPTTPGTPPPTRNSTEGAPVSNHGLTTSHSQPIYVPGKYSVINGCLDCEFLVVVNKDGGFVFISVMCVVMLGKNRSVCRVYYL